MKLTLIEKRVEAGDATSFIFKPEHLIQWIAGQYLQYTLPHTPADERGEKHWFTISAAPGEEHVMLTTRFAGADKTSSFKRALFNLPIGATVVTNDPDGDFIIADPNDQYVWLAGGIGITPFRSMLKDLDGRMAPINVELLYANRDDKYVFKNELESLAEQHPNFHIHYFTGERKIEAEDLHAFFAETPKASFYVSGPEPMVEHYVAVFDQIGIPKEQQKTDYFPGYEYPGLDKK